MSIGAFQTAQQAAFRLIQLYGQESLRFARRPTLREFGDPDQLIHQALSESQRLLNRASEQALLKKIAFLKSARKRQLAINYVHFVTGSAFVLQIAGNYPNTIKWVGAFLAFAAGIISLLLPRNLAALEQSVFTDSETVASLIGEIGKLQVDLAVTPASKNEKLAGEAADVIGRTLALAKKYKLDNMAAQSGLFSKTTTFGNKSSH